MLTGRGTACRFNGISQIHRTLFPKSLGELQPLATDVCEYLEHNTWQSLLADQSRGLCAGLSPRTCGCPRLSSAKLMIKVRKGVSEVWTVRGQVRDGERHPLPAVPISWEVPRGSVLTSPPLLLGLRIEASRKRHRPVHLCSSSAPLVPWALPGPAPPISHLSAAAGPCEVIRVSPLPTALPGLRLLSQDLAPEHLRGGYPPVPTRMCQLLPSPPAPASLARAFRCSPLG